MKKKTGGDKPLPYERLLIPKRGDRV